ncbi:MAG: phosphonate ABC transporter ATP-binding protein [Bdellovibrionales bacterium]
MKSAILSIRGLRKTYPNGVEALKGVSFDVYPGEFLVVIGLSGSGKSTLLRCINRLIDPTSGKIIFRNQAIETARGKEVRDVRRRIAMVFQNFNLIPRHTVLSNVLMGRLGVTSALKSIFGMFPAQDVANAQNYLKLVGISEKAELRADQLSGGQQQRVAIARALAQNPELLLADEPVASLDPATAHIVMDYLRQVNKELGITVVCNLHFLSLVREYATRVIALRAGEIVYEGDPKEINEEWFKKIYGKTAKDVYVR